MPWPCYASRRPVDSSTQPTAPATDDTARASKPAGKPTSNNQASSRHGDQLGSNQTSTPTRLLPHLFLFISATPTQIHARITRTHASRHLPSIHPFAPPPPHAHLRRTYLYTTINHLQPSQLIPSTPSHPIPSDLICTSSSRTVPHAPSLLPERAPLPGARTHARPSPLGDPLPIRGVFVCLSVCVLLV
jgi:hypothetical protein